MNGLDTEPQAFVNAVDELKMVILNKAWSKQLNSSNNSQQEERFVPPGRTERTVEQFEQLAKLEFSIQTIWKN